MMYLNGKQCRAILDRAERSGRKLPRKLEDALREQAGMTDQTDVLFGHNDVVYIAGPMTGRPLFNYPRFFGAAGLISKVYRCLVINPAAGREGLTYREYMDIAGENVAKADAVVMLRGWKKSRGARMERALAVKQGKRIVEEEAVLAECEAILQDRNPTIPAGKGKWRVL